jgi:hypothetical protein
LEHPAVYVIKLLEWTTLQASALARRLVESAAIPAKAVSGRSAHWRCCDQRRRLSGNPTLFIEPAEHRQTGEFPGRDETHGDFRRVTGDWNARTFPSFAPLRGPIQRTAEGDCNRKTCVCFALLLPPRRERVEKPQRSGKQWAWLPTQLTEGCAELPPVGRRA